MKTDKEIRDFIDSKEVLTQRELNEFIYGYWKTVIPGTTIYKYWQYVLQTKDWKKLRNYRENKINFTNFKMENFNKYKEIYEKDSRIRERGSRYAQRILEQVYKFHLARNIIISYKRKIENVSKRDFRKI